MLTTRVARMTRLALLNARSDCSTAARYLVPVALGLVLVPLPSGAFKGDHGVAPSEAPARLAPSIQALAVAGDRTVYAGSFGSGVFRSADRGATWERVGDGITDPFVLSLTAAPDGTVYAGTFQAGVFQSRDGGKSWRAINDGLKRLEIKVLLVRHGVLYAGTADGVYSFQPKTDRWTGMTEGLADTLVHTIVMGRDKALFAGTSGKGVLRYGPDAANARWTRLRQGLVDHEGLIENFIRVLAVDKHDVLYAGTFDGGVFRSGDGGQSWRNISRALPNDSIRGIVTNDRGLFVATGRGVYRSQNDGRQWTAANNGLTQLSVQVLVEGGDGALYAGTTSGVFRSDDDGQTWIGGGAGMEAMEARPPFPLFR